jgi:hypothetical protein
LKKVKDPMDKSRMRPTEKPIFQARLFLRRETTGIKSASLDSGSGEIRLVKKGAAEAVSRRSLKGDSL